MTTSDVVHTELDGALGVTPPTSGLPLCVFGPATAGPFDTPAGFGRDRDLIAAFGGGPGVEACAYYLNQYGRSVVFCRTNASTAGAYGTPVVAGTGTSVASMDATTHPTDDFELVFLVVAGGTIGTTGITYRYSLDGGRSGLSTDDPLGSLGTAATFTFPGTGGAKMDFAAGTLVAGDRISVRCSAPTFTAADLATALEALRVSEYSWQVGYAAGVVTADTFAALETGFTNMRTINKRRLWIGNTRIRNETGETRAQYVTALQSIFSGLSTTQGCLYAGDAKVYSNISGRRYRRPAAFAAAAREAWLEEHQNAAQIDWGPLQGVTLGDNNGNPDCHDEMLFPGLDDLRFATLRTRSGRQGAYVNDPRILCPTGSDYIMAPYRRVMNVFEETLVSYLESRLQRPIQVNAVTGRILDEDARDIENGAIAQIDAVLGSGPKISGRSFSVSRTDNLLATRRLTCSGAVVPLAYPKVISLVTSFVNPVRQLIRVAA